MIKIFRTLILIVILSLNVNNIQATKSVKNGNGRFDSIQVSLLTCTPHDEIYSLYGHTAIRYQDKADGIDVAINYGVFSFSKPHFILRFVFGLTDYTMGIQNFEDFCAEYKHYGSGVTEQVLNLSPDEKLALYEALQKNSLPENSVYRYNYFYNNCTTKARDIILNNIKGEIIYKRQIDENVSFRDMIHQCTKNHLWARFGNDLLLGIKADAKTSRKDQQFLPENLMKDFSTAVIDRGYIKEPLVKETHQIVEPNITNEEDNGFYITPQMCGICLFLLTFVISFIEALTRKVFWHYDAILLSFCGIAGLILLAMVFSQHPTVNLNLQILILNPLFLYAAYYIIRYRKKKIKTIRLWRLIDTIVLLSALGVVLQDFADGMIFLALSLLLRGRVIIDRKGEYPIYFHKKTIKNNEK